jgi:dipeptidyl aminopeptidase/acylaminoacyl peptidase
MDNMAFCNKSCPAAALASAIACLTAPVSGGAQDAAPVQVPLEVFGGLQTLENVVISPNGKRLAFVRISGDTRALLVVDIGKATPVGGVRVSETKLRDVAWIDDDNVLVTTSITSLPPFGFTGAKREWSQMVVFDVDKKKLHALDFAIEHEQTLNTSIGEAEVRTIGEKTVLFVPGLYVTDRTMPGLFAFTLPGYRARLVARGTTQDTDWLIDEAGQIAGQFTYHDDEKTWEIKARTDGKMRQIAAGKASIDTPDIVGFDADGSSIIARFPVNGNWIWKPLNLKQNNWGEALDSGRTFWSVIKDRKSGRIIGGTHGAGDARYVFFDNELQAHWNALLRAFPDEKVHLVSHSDDFSRMVVEVLGARDGYVYALFDWYSHQATVLGAVYNGLALPAEVRSVDYLAADGLRISGFLTMPRVKEAKNLPLVVMPHGGPEASDSGDFDWWAQALAAQGYAVLQPNFRGSNNTSELLEAGFGEWGRKMQTDLSDGVRDLAKRGLIDPKRVCIVGASYGGYAALAGVTLDPGVYRCAVAVAGISDMRRMRNWIGDNHSSAGQRYWDRFIGVTDKKAASVDEISPITHIAAVTVPVLLIHGRDDTVVPFEQSEIMVDALKKAGKPVEFLTLKHEDHWLSTGATRLQMLQATAAFLNTHNPAN